MSCFLFGCHKKKSNYKGNSTSPTGGGGQEKKLNPSGSMTAPTAGGQHGKASNGAGAYIIPEKRDSWILDSGCTDHFAPNRELFVSFKVSKGAVKLSDYSSVEIEGIGDIVMKMHDGANRLIKDVKYVPKFTGGLISESRLDDRGYDIVTHNGEKVVKDGDKVVMKCKKQAGWYHVQGHAAINPTTDIIQEARNSVL